MRFELLGGHLALDFLNTVGGREHTTERRYTVEREHFLSAADLYEWSAHAGVITAAERRKLEPRATPRLLKRAIELREALYRTFVAVTEERRPESEDLAVLNRELKEQRVGIKDGKPAFLFETRDAADLPLWLVARAAAELLTSDDVKKVRRCGGESCGWLFLDTSRNRSRQWCDMRDCGNVAKVRRFRERQRSVR